MIYKTRRSLLRITALTCLTLGAASLLAITFSSCISRPLIFPGPQAGASDAYYQRFFQGEDAVEWRSEDGTTLRGWLIRRGNNAPLIAMYGGNAMNVGAFHELATADQHNSYLLLNYRGYGESEGSPSQEAIVKDSTAAITWAQQQLGGSPAVKLVGLSIGSGVAMQVAAKVNPDQVILICPFDSIEAVARDMLGSLGATMVRADAFRSTEVAPSISCPVTIFAGLYDNIVAPSHTHELIKAFTLVKPQVYWLPAGHNDLMSLPEFDGLYLKALNEKAPAPN